MTCHPKDQAVLAPSAGPTVRIFVSLTMEEEAVRFCRGINDGVTIYLALFIYQLFIANEFHIDVCCIVVLHAVGCVRSFCRSQLAHVFICDEKILVVICL